MTPECCTCPAPSFPELESLPGEVLPPIPDTCAACGGSIPEPPDQLELLPGQALAIRPGDTLILGYERMVTVEQADHIKASVRERLPGVDVVVITGVKQIAAYRPDEPEG